MVRRERLRLNTKQSTKEERLAVSQRAFSKHRRTLRVRTKRDVSSLARAATNAASVCPRMVPHSSRRWLFLVAPPRRLSKEARVRNPHTRQLTRAVRVLPPRRIQSTELRTLIPGDTSTDASFGCTPTDRSKLSRRIFCPEKVARLCKLCRHWELARRSSLSRPLQACTLRKLTCTTIASSTFAPRPMRI